MRPLLASPLAFVIGVIAVATMGMVLPISLAYLLGWISDAGLEALVLMGALALSPGIALMILTANDIRLVGAPRRPPSNRDDDLFTLAWEMSFQYQAARTLFIATPLLFLWAVGLVALARPTLPLAEIEGWRITNWEATRTVAIHALLWIGYPVLVRGGALFVMGKVLSRLGSHSTQLFDSAKKTLFYSLGVGIYLVGLGAAIHLIPRSGDSKGMAGWFYVILATYTLLFSGLTIGALSWWSRRR